ncbi:MAG: hypothetical protein C4524_07670 [Candidatus Zixiibacteriota bacterium]|nr:MAG: hypothetical protein C4524_07670 [candidate division Zixibacteria bacterium]
MSRRWFHLFPAICFLLSVAWAQSGGRQIAAEFRFAVGQQGGALELSQPQAVRFDPRRQEVYIADTGHDRIVILDSRGVYQFEIGNDERLRTPTDVAVDPDGRLYVLGSPVQGSFLQVFDYNGDYLGPFRFHGGPDSGSFELNSLALDRDNRLHILDCRGGRVLTYDLSGRFLHQFSFLKELGADPDRELTLGSLAVYGDRLLIPAPMAGTVLCYTTLGASVGAFGYRGGGYGELSFPVAAAMDGRGNVLVLDKHRHTIIGFDSYGKIIGEYGGMGTGPGWFYHPNAMLVDARDRVWVAQGLNNRIQVLQLPGAEERAPRETTGPVVVDE